MENKLLRIVSCMTELSNGHIKYAGISSVLAKFVLPSKHAAKNAQFMQARAWNLIGKFDLEIKRNKLPHFKWIYFVCCVNLNFLQRTNMSGSLRQSHLSANHEQMRRPTNIRHPAHAPIRNFILNFIYSIQTNILSWSWFPRCTVCKTITNY